MLNKINKLLKFGYFLLFFFVPILIIPITSELFEFNKITLVYISTVAISALWLIKIILEKRIIFRRTILDIPLIIFLISQILSTFFSIDPLTSLFGYYSRFHGGLLSSLSYALLYWGFVSNIDYKGAVNCLRMILLSAVFVSLYAIMEHFGIDKNLWVQDVQNRVFSTLGQPNWLAAYVLAIIPLTWSWTLNLKTKNLFKDKKFLLLNGLSVIFFLTLLYTKSRSGLLGFLAADLSFWLLSLFNYKNSAKIKNFIKTCLVANLSFVILVLIVGTPWTPSIQEITKTQQSVYTQSPPNLTTSLETGGTESGEIRKIVWRGALDIWRHYPLLGSGVETFAYSYYQFRPQEHNLVSEWDFLYNKSHNEYLNFLATTGMIGLASYLLLTGFIVYQLTKTRNSFPGLGLLAGFIGILISNFFGFSVVPIAICFFIYPALAVVLSKEKQEDERIKNSKFSKLQVIGLATVATFTCYLLFLVGKYWYADVLYTKGKNFNALQEYPSARMALFKATSLSPLQAVYFDELSQSAVGLALSFYEAGDSQNAKLFAETSINEIEKALSLSPNNLNIIRSKAALFIKLSMLDPKLINETVKTLEKAISLSPTDAKLYYNLGLSYARSGNLDLALETLEKSVTLKENHKDARIALAKIYILKKDFQKAQLQLEYILEKISTDDYQAKLLLEEVYQNLK